jgi:hypothetical protein
VEQRLDLGSNVRTTEAADSLRRIQAKIVRLLQIFNEPQQRSEGSPIFEVAQPPGRGAAAGILIFLVGEDGFEPLERPGRFDLATQLDRQGAIGGSVFSRSLDQMASSGLISKSGQRPRRLRPFVRWQPETIEQSPDRGHRPRIAQAGQRTQGPKALLARPERFDQNVDPERIADRCQSPSRFEANRGN